ncbi:Reverse transcriptase (RNA-dependent DNA polymerase) [Nesidiocoris tenuis]|uniref:Reverse transcriptase (RNA-dependent DNA polymerase) n=2 Tax=Nesidiocoris tenuis TaxID=355587 RepID=A0ABN7B0U2_9HEMI|nr:Reverse transcriptase (RNA-dependent DNA polymerase) [Nesidiocoris tenuis]
MQSLYSHATFQVRIRGQLSESIDLTEGVLQGETLSPLLFALFLADVEDYFRANNCSGLDVDGRRDALLLLYADDMVILGDSIVDINRKLGVLQSYCSLNKLVVNTAKTKLVCFRRAGSLKKLALKAFYEGREIEQVKSYSYLGIPFSSSAVFANAKDNFLSRANAASAATTSILVRAHIESWSARKLLFHSVVRSVCLYASSVWGLRYADEMERVQVGYYKRILVLPRGTPSSFVRLEAGVAPLFHHIVSDGLKWLVKVLSMQHDRLPYACMARLISLSALPSCDVRYNWFRQLATCLARLEFRFSAHTDAIVRSESGTFLSASLMKLYRLDLERIQSSPFSNFYPAIIVGNSFNPQPYLLVVQPLVSLRPFAQLRSLGAHGARILVAGSVIRFGSSCCPLCNLGSPDSPLHLLLCCPMLATARLKFLAPLLPTPLSFEEQFRRILLMTERAYINRIYFFLCEVAEIRDLILDC